MLQATLNARTSILAAANPIDGRYNRAKSLKQNVNMSAPIMSRFDLFFILVDECNEVTPKTYIFEVSRTYFASVLQRCASLSHQVTDYAIARRIVDLHARNVESVERVYSTDEVQRYILFARQFQPKVRYGLYLLLLVFH